MIELQVADEEERQRAIVERERNVIVDAGAGTGKTTLLVKRIVHLIAPEDDGPCFPLDRVAAITFTRKAAGELKLRLRQALLEHHAKSGSSAVRAQRLAQAIEVLDNAPIGTVHSFADRLLRLRPADACVSPEYEIMEDAQELVDETFHWLLEATKQDSLVHAFRGTDLETLAAEAGDTVDVYIQAGFRLQTLELENYSLLGLDALVSDLITTRDRELRVGEAAQPDMAHVRRVADELVRLVADHKPISSGGRAIHRLVGIARRLARAEHAAEPLRLTRTWKDEYRPGDYQKGKHFDGDDAGWDIWKWITKGERGARKTKEERPDGPLGPDLIRPLMAWMASRLVRLRPIVLARYQQLKRERQVLDQIDLLIELRDLLRNNLEARAFYQARFDHILVDEFQDTDPLQAEILLFLCEQGAKAAQLDELSLASGKLTIVGDPKQSIYRFRRADIGMYVEVCERVRKAPTCESTLSTNFRSTARIIEWVNTAFDEVLGKVGEQPAFDKDKGAVCNMPLAAGRAPGRAQSVHVLPFGHDGLVADEAREVEGEALARYLRHLVEQGDTTIVDPRSGKPRRPRYGDIAVLMVSTQKVHYLLGELDRIGVPHVVRGGTLFMRDDLHRQFVLGLRALSDPNDGVAQAALLRPPFFAVTLEDLVRERFKASPDAVPAVLQEARTLSAALRRTRHEQSPGEVARALLERSGFGTFVAAGDNGEQRLARLYELCLALDQRARETNLDFDATTEMALGWLDAPIQMEAPLPVDADAVQVITVHQAKGLEWPVVALWDGRGGWGAYLPVPALSVDALTGEWAIELEGVKHDTTNSALREGELAMRREERKRVAYVAATRARDVLIVPEAGSPDNKTIAGKLLMSTASLGAKRVDAYLGDGDAWWDLPGVPSMRPVAAARADLESAWSLAVGEALRPRLVPMGVSAVTHVVHCEVEEGEEPPPKKSRDGRYGPAFGSVVHRALELVLTKCVADAATAVRLAAREVGLGEHLAEAEADVLRTCAALEAAGLMRSSLRLEYPIAGSLEESALLVGYIDLLALTDDELVVVDFKTDQPPQGDPRVVYPGYVAQVGAYAQLLKRAGVGGKRQVRPVLLFTGDGQLRWV
jgi:ATP-dependent exoDNAse (exonuclease V) beta subunit